MTDAAAARQDDVLSAIDPIIRLADAAMALGAPERIVGTLTAVLRPLLPEVAAALPPALRATDSAGYVRRELYRSARHGYQILAIAWAPGQGSAVHDHADVWGVEAVLRGQLEVVDYRIAGRHDALAELHPAGHHSLPAGSVIGLLPPHDLHSCRNAGAREVAVSLHIYGRPLHEVIRYAHVENALYRPERVELTSV